jgi:alkylation response protein AidB-like acyl-CoA dehydrogenase
VSWLTRASSRPDLVIGWWAAPTILEHGSKEQIERFVPPTLSGELFWCQLFSEPGAGSDLASLRMKAVRAEGGWKLTGQKVWTSRANWAPVRRLPGAHRPRRAQAQGHHLLPRRHVHAGHRRPSAREITGEDLFNEVFFDDVFVPDEMVVGEVNDGWRLARTTLANERVAMAHGTALGNPMEEVLRTVARLISTLPCQDSLGG